ncbi:unnamed protein product, partial [Ectocarpus fasciculatus]
IIVLPCTQLTQTGSQRPSRWLQARPAVASGLLRSHRSPTDYRFVSRSLPWQFLPWPGNLHQQRMTRCPVCDGVGFGGVTCARCHGKRFRTESNPCLCCNANGAPKGGFLSLLGHWSICRLCQGLKYLTEQPLPCPKCNATGEGSFLRIFRMTCDLCEGRRYVLSRHKPCIKCPSSSFFFISINCNGINCTPSTPSTCAHAATAPDT